MIVGSLGNVVFEVSSSRVFTIGPFTIEREIKFEDHEVTGTFPRPEWLGPGLASMSLDIVLRRNWGCDPYKEARELEEMSIDGTVLRLVVAGINLGNWTIRKLGQNWSRLDGANDGAGCIALSLELKEYL